MSSDATCYIYLIAHRDAAGQLCAPIKEGQMHVDHVIPLIRGGTNDPSNLVVACRACNCGKSGRTPEQWRGGLQ